MPEWIQPEYHELDQAEIEQMLDTKEISKPAKTQSRWESLISFFLITVGMVALSLLLLVY